MDPICDTILWYAIGRSPAMSGTPIVSRFLRERVVEITEKQSTLFCGLVKEISEPVHRQSHDIQMQAIWDEIFIDGVINWGRILVIVAFAATLARHYYLSTGDEDYAEHIAYKTKEYFNDRLAPWVIEQGGWKILIGQ